MCEGQNLQQVDLFFLLWFEQSDSKLHFAVTLFTAGSNSKHIVKRILLPFLTLITLPMWQIETTTGKKKRGACHSEMTKCETTTG